MPLFALVDCNNFYASCERAFNPKLDGKPVIVLSNNDGNIISRSSEAKKMGIPMGAPFYKWQAFCANNNVFVFSSNYELYGDMSQRVMTTLKNYCPLIEIYSIDEAFLVFDELKDVTNYMIKVRRDIKKWTGIPVSIGVSATKTLAKIANSIAKNRNIENVYYLSNFIKKNALSQFSVNRIWGIGTQTANNLNKLNIHTAQHLHDANQKMIRNHFNVVVERVVQELQGISCIPMESITPDRKQIICSRSFGKPVTTLQELEEAISHHAAIASAKLRKQKCATSSVYVFMETNIFKKNNPYYGNGVFFPFPIPTMDSRYIIRVAKKCIKYLYKREFVYHKVGLALFDLIPDSIQQYDMLNFDFKKTELLMKSVDLINHKLGRNTLYFCAEGIQRTWQTKANHLSPCYTTRWDELLKVHCK